MSKESRGPNGGSKDLLIKSDLTEIYNSWVEVTYSAGELFFFAGLICDAIRRERVNPTWQDAPWAGILSMPHRAFATTLYHHGERLENYQKIILKELDEATNETPWREALNRLELALATIEEFEGPLDNCSVGEHDGDINRALLVAGFAIKEAALRLLEAGKNAQEETDSIETRLRREARDFNGHPMIPTGRPSQEAGSQA